ncbi:MAG: PH domain-containing protein [Phycisphaerae bacterium]|nr:PH domain-containing protein [Phycisphaerae bacterium]
MAKALEQAQAELEALGLKTFGTIMTYRGGLDIILNHMDENEVIKDMTTGISSRVTYIMAVTDAQLLCGSKPMIGKEKELTYALDEIESMTLKSPFLLGHNIIVKLKNGQEIKFNSDDKKAAARFVNTASSLV